MKNCARYTYSLNGQRLSVRDANNNRSVYVYDGLDRLCRLYFPVTALGANVANTGGVAEASLTCASAGTAPDYEGYGYDANGNRTSLRLRSAETIAFTYDNLNRESVKDIPGGTATDVYSAYDLAGRRLSARFVSASGQGIVYAYDTAGRLASETNTIGASRALAYQYDIASNRTRVTWPDATYASYTYDALNRVDLVQENGTTTLADYNYDPLARRATITRGNGTVTTYSYDTASRLTGLAQDLPSTANDQTLGFAYTAASQISQRTASNDNFNWAASAVSRNYNRNGLNQYTSTTGTGAASFAYDLRGNLTSDGSRTFVYDLENRLTQVSGGASGSLTYDPLGRLRQYTASSATTDFLYDGDRLSAEYNSSGTLLRRYVHGPGVDEPLVWYEGAGLTDRRYLVTDHQGSVIAENGATTTRYSYGPYGEPNAWTGSRFRYTGQVALPDVQLYHYKARVYDPVLGRFLQTDPVGYEDDLNLYAYVANDPLNRNDPTGRQSRTAAVVRDYFARIIAPRREDPGPSGRLGAPDPETPEVTAGVGVGVTLVAPSAAAVAPNDMAEPNVREVFVGAAVSTREGPQAFVRNSEGYSPDPNGSVAMDAEAFVVNGSIEGGSTTVSGSGGNGEGIDAGGSVIMNSNGDPVGVSGRIGVGASNEVLPSITDDTTRVLRPNR